MKKLLIDSVLCASLLVTNSRAETLVPDGTYISGNSARLTPNGTYVGGTLELATDGSYVGGKPHLASNGTYIQVENHS